MTEVEIRDRMKQKAKEDAEFWNREIARIDGERKDAEDELRDCLAQEACPHTEIVKDGDDIDWVWHCPTCGISL